MAARTFSILNPNGMKDSTTIQAEPNAQAVVDAMAARKWSFEDGLYVALATTGGLWFAFRVETQKQHIGTEVT